MAARKTILIGSAIAALLAIFFCWIPSKGDPAVDAEVESLVQAYDDAIYLNGDYKLAKEAADKILNLADKSSDPQSVEIRGLMRLASGNWGNDWGKKLKRCALLASDEFTIENAEYFLYLGKIRGKYQSRFEEGLELTRKSLSISQHFKDDRTLALSYTNLSELHMFLGQKSEVARNAYLGVTVARHHGQKAIIATTLRNLVGDLRYLGKVVEARSPAEELLKISPNNSAAISILLPLADSEKSLLQFEQPIKDRIAEIKKAEETRRLSRKEISHYAKSLYLIASGFLERNNLAKCREYAELALPRAKIVGDDTTRDGCLHCIELARLDLAGDSESIAKIVSSFEKENEVPHDVIAAAYARVGNVEECLKYKDKELERREKQHASEIGFLREDSKLYWETELRTREQAEISDRIAASSRLKGWILGTTVVLGTTVCTLLGSFYFLLRRERDSLEKVVESRTSSLSRALKKANAADLAKNDFLAQINHEIRHPLTAILSYCDLLLTNGNRFPEFVNGIESSSQHLRELVDKLLEVSKIESSGLEANLREFLPEQTVSDINGIMAEQAARNGLEFECTFIGDHQCPVSADETKIRQIAINLVGNAIKFTKKGSVVVSFELKEQDECSAAELSISVKDTGIGIAENEAERIFNRFSKASNNVASEGSGLGLFISRKLVNCLGGELSLKSELDAGTHVQVTLPIKLASDSSGQSELPVAREQFDSADSVPAVIKRVLVVDDQEMIRTTLQLQLKAHGLKCETTEELLQTIELVENWQPDLVLLDLRMPKYSGFQVFEKIRGSSNPRVPVYAITGDATVEVQQKCLGLGFDGFIIKPFKINEILDVLSFGSRVI